MHAHIHKHSYIFLGRSEKEVLGSLICLQMLAEAQLQDVRSWFRPHSCSMVLAFWDAYL